MGHIILVLKTVLEETGEHSNQTCIHNSYQVIRFQFCLVFIFKKKIYIYYVIFSSSFHSFIIFLYIFVCLQLKCMAVHHTAVKSSVLQFTKQLNVPLSSPLLPRTDYMCRKIIYTQKIQQEVLYRFNKIIKCKLSLGCIFRGKKLLVEVNGVITILKLLKEQGKILGQKSVYSAVKYSTVQQRSLQDGILTRVVLLVVSDGLTSSPGQMFTPQVKQCKYTIGC